MSEPIDVVAEMRGSLIALSHTTDITRDKINRWADEVERLQAENTRYASALVKLSVLGNGEQRGNSIGNDIAWRALNPQTGAES